MRGVNEGRGADDTYTNGTGGAGGVDSAYAAQSVGPVFSQAMSSQPADFAEPPRKRIRSDGPSLSQQTDTYYAAPLPSQPHNSANNPQPKPTNPLPIETHL